VIERHTCDKAALSRHSQHVEHECRSQETNREASDMAGKKPSLVWCYFSPVDKVTARCQVCDKKAATQVIYSNI